jgi:methyltransferase
MTWSAAVLAFVTLQRLGELALARRNTMRLRAQGAAETGAGHYPLIVALHAVWLAGLWLLAWDIPPSLSWLVVFAVLQVLRVWVLVTLGSRWTTRILVLPGAPLVSAGPYRFMRHPNYVVVIGEIAVLPLAFGLVWYALAFTMLNAAVLAVRIKAENNALARRGERARSD